MYPSATHKRFEHCIGVSYLAKKQMEIFQTKQPELEVTDQEIRNVTIAGLTHDLGHGPFSHCFDGVVIPELQRMKMNSAPTVNGQPMYWCHEQGSTMMLRNLIESHPTLSEKITD